MSAAGVPALYLDNDVTLRAVPLLLAQGHRVETTAGHNRRAAGDHEQLLFAAEHGWILVTHNWEDFKLLQGAWQLWSHSWDVAPRHAGILVVEQAGEIRIAAAVSAFFAAYGLGDATNALWRHKATTGWVRISV
jgi:hypothetical protein